MGGSPQRRLRVPSILAAASVVVGLAIAVPITATAAPANPAATLVANITSTYDPAYPEGQQGAWDASNSSTGAPTLTTHLIRVGAAGEPAANQFSLDLYPPAGQSLHAGYYAGVESGMGEAGHANVQMDYAGSSENFRGDVEIRDLAANADGTVTRFDLFFHLLSIQASRNLFGEVRLGETEPAGHVLSARAMDWPKLPVGSLPVWSTEWLHNTSVRSETIGQAALVTGSAGDFRLANDTCSGTSLAPGNSCSIRIGFSPRHAGPRASALAVLVDGRRDTEQLTGSAPPGVSSLVTSGEDYVDADRTWRYVDGPEQLSAGYRPGFLGFGVTRVYDDAFDNENVVLTVPPGHKFTPGIHVTTNLYSRSTYGLSVSGHGRGCGSYSGKVNITQLVLATDGAPIRADIAISQICDEDPTARMTGELKWRVAKDTTPPPAASQLHVNSAHTAGWTNPRVADFSYTRVRLTTATVNPRSLAAVGYVVYIGHGRTAQLPALTHGHRYTLSAASVDTTGNIGPATFITLIG